MGGVPARCFAGSQLGRGGHAELFAAPADNRFLCGEAAGEFMSHRDLVEGDIIGGHDLPVVIPAPADGLVVGRDAAGVIR